MPEKQDYKQLITEFVQKQMIILGPNIALDHARKVSGLTVSDDGAVLEMGGDGQMLLKALLLEYAELSGQVAQMALKPLLEKYPGIKV